VFDIDRRRQWFHQLERGEVVADQERRREREIVIYRLGDAAAVYPSDIDSSGPRHITQSSSVQKGNIHLVALLTIM
jgi:hypothetical protein